MQQNKIGRYFKYAIGEIILVVIGILIALQINNWNQERITKNHNQIILKNLISEFSSNTIALDSSLLGLSKVIKALENVLIYTQQTEPEITQENFERLLEKTFVTPSWTPSSYVLAEMKTSGELSNIQNNDLKQILFKWERDFSAMKTREKAYDKYAEDYIEFISKYGSVRNLDALSARIPTLTKSIIGKNELSLLRSIEFENRVENFYFLAYLLEKEYQEIKSLMNTIVQLAKTEIND